MTIYRGAGGSGDATNDATVTAVAAYAAQAATSATNSANSATTSGTSATNAANSASSAAASASAAATSASQASSSQSAAATSATTAANNATSAGTQATAATNQANNAANSATAAAASATTATTKASEAATSATNAATSATNSANSAASALAIYGNTTAMNNAVTSATNSASSAATSATQAATSANSASDYATQAGISAGLAGNSAANAANSASSAATSAANASQAANTSTGIYGSLAAVQTAAASATTSANNAATSATNAANSATQAANSAASAAAIVTGVASNRPSIRPSLLLDFSNTKQLDPRITFSRPTTATYYDGKTVVKAEENLVSYSQQFDISGTHWGKTNCTVTANSDTAPDGTATADLVTTNTSGAVSILYNYYNAGLNRGAGKTVTLSCWVRSASGSDLPFRFSYGPSGSIFTSEFTATTTWQRFSVQIITNANDLVGITKGVSTDLNHYVWGFQAEERSTVTAYTPTTTAPITNYIPALQTAVSNDARFDHDPVTGESKGLLIEEQRTNLLTYSSEFDNAAWTKPRVTVSANSVIAPDGTLTADLATTTVGTSDSIIQFATLTNAVHTFSFFVKASGSTTSIQFAINSGGLLAATGTVISGPGSVSGTTLLNLTGLSTTQWTRVSLTTTSATPAGTGSVYLYPGGGNSIGLSVALWGAQLEAGSFPTSYIPCQASQVTRSADVASMTGANFTSWYRTDEGSLYTEINTKSLAAANGVQLNDGTTSNRIRLALTSASDQGTVTYQGSAQATLDGGTPVAGTTSKVTIGYKLNDFALSLDGGAVATDTSGAIPVATQLQIGAETSTAGNLTIKRIMYWPKRLVNSELQGVTS